MFWFVVLLLIAGAGFYFYQKLVKIEQEIRAEQGGAPVPEEAPKAPESSPEKTFESVIVTPVVEDLTTPVVPVEDASFSLEDEVLAAVTNLPGVKQTELYSGFADVSKKQLQQKIKDLSDQGLLTREKQGNSYLLYPV